MTDKQLLEYINLVVNKPHLKPREMRRGQWMFNALASFDHTLADQCVEESSKASCDPFYRDENIPNFWEWLVKNYNK